MRVCLHSFMVAPSAHFSSTSYNSMPSLCYALASCVPLLTGSIILNIPSAVDAQGFNACVMSVHAAEAQVSVRLLDWLQVWITNGDVATVDFPHCVMFSMQ